MKKIIVWAIALVLWVSLGSYIYIYKWATLSSVEANPDYICKKSVTDQPCVVNTCEEWKTDWTRVCNWTRATEVSYYLIRTNCEAWYTKVSKGWNVWWNSWRQWADYVSNSESCTVVEVDTVPPLGDISE